MDIRLLLQVFATVRSARRRAWWARPRLEVYQSEALDGLRQHIYAHSPFYKKFHHGLTDRPLQELPVLTKAIMMEHFDDLVTDQAIRLEAVRAYMTNRKADQQFLGRYYVNATSGSTGQPGIFLFDRSEWITVLASFARAHEWAGVKVNLMHRMKMASVASESPWHMSSQVGLSLKSWWLPTLRMAASEPLGTIIESLNAWQPEMLIGYASMARILADEQLSGRLHIAPDLVYTSSEVLTDETRRRIEAAWGQPPFNTYGATETGGLAAECAEGRRMHLFEDLVIAEVVDEHNRPVPPGVYGDKLLITSLFSYTQPLIRYELSDSVQLAAVPVCLCGRSFVPISGIQGRGEDVLHFPSAAEGEVAVHPITFHQILDGVSVGGWQVIQEADGLKVLLSGVGDQFVDETLVKKLRRLSWPKASIPRM